MPSLHALIANEASSAIPHLLLIHVSIMQMIYGLRELQAIELAMRGDSVVGNAQQQPHLSPNLLKFTTTNQ